LDHFNVSEDTLQYRMTHAVLMTHQMSNRHTDLSLISRVPVSGRLGVPDALNHRRHRMPNNYYLGILAN